MIIVTIVKTLIIRLSLLFIVMFISFIYPLLTTIISLFKELSREYIKLIFVLEPLRAAATYGKDASRGRRTAEREAALNVKDFIR